MNKPVDDSNPSELENNIQNLLAQFLMPPLMILHHKIMKFLQMIWMLSQLSLSRQAQLNLLRRRLTMLLSLDLDSQLRPNPPSYPSTAQNKKFWLQIKANGRQTCRAILISVLKTSTLVI